MQAALRHIAPAADCRQGRQAGKRPASSRGAWQDNVDWASLMRDIAARRDRDAFGTVFSHFAPRVKAMLMKLGTAPELADDLAQEAMLTVWRKADQFDPSSSAVAAWIYTIARNLRIDALRRTRPSTTLADIRHEAWEDNAPRP